MSAACPLVEGEGFILRPWRLDDRDALVRHANDEGVSRGLSDRFPYPYTRQDADNFLSHPVEPPSLVLAIEIEGEAVGGIGMRPGEDTLRIGSQLGYWLGRQYWGRGLMSRIVPRWCAHVFANYGFERLQATVLSNNPASARVLEKSGFAREGTLRRAAIKRNEVLDLWMYAMLRPEADSARRGS
jgi:RimJ/RimL family protein N-acetyltransferase